MQVHMLHAQSGHPSSCMHIIMKGMEYMNSQNLALDLG